VLLTEEGIAKGVRRIVAVTGPQAAVEATLKAKSLRTELDEARTFKGALLDARIGEVRQRLGVDKEVSLLMKKDMLQELDNLKAGQLQAGKAASKEFEKQARQRGEELAAEANAAPGQTYVGVIDVAGADDAKSVNFAMEAARSVCVDKAMLFLSNSGGKLALSAIVPPALTSTLSAKDWTAKALDAAGGKGGGNADKAQGQAKDPSRLDAALTAAKSYP